MTRFIDKDRDDSAKADLCKKYRFTREFCFFSELSVIICAALPRQNGD